MLMNEIEIFCLMILAKRINEEKFKGSYRDQIVKTPVTVTFCIQGPMNMVVLVSKKGFLVKFPPMILAPIFNKNTLSNPNPQVGNSGWNWYSVPICKNCCKSHSRKCMIIKDNWIGCGNSGHFSRNLKSRNDKENYCRKAPPSYFGFKLSQRKTYLIHFKVFIR